MRSAESCPDYILDSARVRARVGRFRVCVCSRTVQNQQVVLKEADAHIISLPQTRKNPSRDLFRLYSEAKIEATHKSLIL